MPDNRFLSDDYEFSYGFVRYYENPEGSRVMSSGVVSNDNTAAQMPEYLHDLRVIGAAVLDFLQNTTKVELLAKGHAFIAKMNVSDDEPILEDEQEPDPYRITYETSPDTNVIYVDWGGSKRG